MKGRGEGDVERRERGGSEMIDTKWNKKKKWR